MLKIYKIAAAALALFMGLVAVPTSAYAQDADPDPNPDPDPGTEIKLPPTSPSDTINAFDFPEGMNAFQIEGSYCINRAFEGTIDLFRNGELIRSIPASNKERLDTWMDVGEGSSRVEFGYVAIRFWNKTTDPGSISGNYEVLVPAGILYLDEQKTVTNPEWRFKVRVFGTASGKINIEPADGSSLSKLSKFVFTLPDDGNYKWNKTNAKIYIDDLYGDMKNVNCTTEFDGMKCTITAETEITDMGTYYLHIPNGFYLVKNGDSWSAANSATINYYVAPDLSEGVTIEPDNSVSHMYIKGNTVDGINRYVLFTLNLPDPVSMILMQKPKFYALDEHGLPTDDPIQEFALIKDPNDSKKLYVCSLELVDPTAEEGGDFMPPAGDYALVIPRQAYYVNKTIEEDGQSVLQSVPNGEYLFRYEIGVNADFPVTVYPSDGAKLNNLEYVSVTFDEGNVISFPSNGYAHITDGIVEYAILGEITEDLPNEVRFVLPYPLKKEGVYTFSTPAGVFTVNGNKTSVSSTYTIDPSIPVVDRDLKVTPAAGEVESLQEFKVIFAAYPEAEVSQVGGKITLTNKDGENINIPVKYYKDEEKYFFLDLETPITEPGVYTLRFEANTLFAVNEFGSFVQNREESYVYTILAPGEISRPAISPEEGSEIKEFQEFVLTLPEGEVITKVASIDSDLRAYIGPENGPSNVLEGIKTADNKITLKPWGELAEMRPGEYTLYIPAGYFETENGVSAEYTYKFKMTSDGVVIIEDADAPADVYNAAGILVLRNADAEAVKTLDKGLYIYKGRKIIVK